MFAHSCRDLKKRVNMDLFLPHKRNQKVSEILFLANECVTRPQRQWNQDRSVAAVILRRGDATLNESIFGYLQPSLAQVPDYHVFVACQ